MDRNDIQQLIQDALHGVKFDQGKVEELVDEISIILDKQKRPERNLGPNNSVLESSLKDQMNLETDWRKKAAIAARIISISLE